MFGVQVFPANSQICRYIKAHRSMETLDPTPGRMRTEINTASMYKIMIEAGIFAIHFLCDYDLA